MDASNEGAQQTAHAHNNPAPTLAQLKALDVNVEFVVVHRSVLLGLVTMVNALAARLAEHEGEDARLP